MRCGRLRLPKTAADIKRLSKATEGSSSQRETTHSRPPVMMECASGERMHSDGYRELELDKENENHGEEWSRRARHWLEMKEERRTGT